MATQNGTVDLPRLSRVATILPKTLNDEMRTVDVVWTTGAPVLRGYGMQYWERLSLDAKAVMLKRLNNGAPLLNAHNDYDARGVVGVVESGTAVLDGKRGIATVRFAKAEDDPVADAIYRKVKDGILQNISVGYATYEMTKVSEGGADKIPIYEATKWEPFELSVVPMGADDGAGFRAASTERFTCRFITRQQENKKMADENTDTTGQAAQDAPSAVATRAANEAETAIAAANKSLRAARAQEAQERAAREAKIAEDAAERERARWSGIRTVAAQSGLGDTWATSLYGAGATVEKARATALEVLHERDCEFGPTDDHVRIGAVDDQRDKYIRGAAAWLIERTGKRRLLEQAKKQQPELFDGLEFGGGAAFRGLSPMEIARDTLERQNVKTRGMDKMRMLGLAFTYRAGSMQTTSDFAIILENVLHKMLLGSYATQETTWPIFCGTEDVPDFRPSNRYRTGSLTSLPLVLEHGEYKNGTIPDAAKYAISTERHGEIFSLSREAIVNDDMGALSNLAMEFGRAAARTIENDVYALLALNAGLGPTMPDGVSFFHANHANIGTGAVISVVSLDADRVLMRAQKDPSGKDFLSLRPRVLLVPDALEGTARVINVAQYDPDTANKIQRPNMVQGLFTEIIGSPRLAATTTRRYQFADPAVAAAFVVAFLEGYGRGPIMESQAGWRIDGVEWRVTQYARAQAADPKAAVTNAGTP